MYRVSKLTSLEQELKEAEKKTRAKPSVERTKGSREIKLNQLVKKLQKRKKSLK